MQLKRHIRFVAIVCITLLVATLSLIAAEYRGQVKFSGLPLPGAQITATQSDKKLTAVSDEQGNFVFQDLPDGAWQLQVDMLGFTPVKQEVTQGTGLPGPSFELKMLPLDQIQAVAAPAAPAAPAVTTAAPTQTTTATPTPTEAPTPSLNASIAAANAGAAAAKPPAKGKPAKGAVAPTGASAFQRTDLSGAATPPPPATGAAAAPEVTGELQSRAADSFLINGSAQNGASSPFAQNPAFGNNRKGGPRFYTYSLTLNESNNALNAESFSQIGHSAKLPANQLTGGFNFGGPIYIPHLIEKRNNVQLTVNYARTEARNETFNPVLMPTAAERAGDFSNVLTQGGQPVQILNPSTGQPFANATIPVSQISLQALSLLQYYPQPNFFGSSAYNYQIPLIANTHTDQIRTTASKNFKRRNFVSGRYAAQDTRSDNDTNFNFLDTRRSLGMIATATYRRTYTPRFYGTFSYQFSRQSIQSLPYFSNLTNVSGNAGITGNDQTPLEWGPPSLGFQQSGITGLSDATASITHNQTSAYSYVGTWNHGRHNITFGGDFRWQQFNTIGQSDPQGRFTFTGAATGYDFADFLVGTPDQSSIAFGNADKYLRSVQPDLYFQDDWKVSPGLSLSLGLRWEYTSPITEKYGRLVNLDVAPGYTAVAPVLASAPLGPLTNMTYPASLVRPYKKEFEPRPAFAWRPFPASSMVVRGGYGISYSTQVYNPFVNQMDQQAPLSKSLQLVNSAANPLTLANGFNALPNVNQDIAAVNPNFRPGYVQAWNLSVQRDLPGSLVMQATYRGTKGTHLMQAFVPNTYPGTPCPTCNYTYYTSGGNQEREAGILNLRRRLHNGFTASLTYTYSKSIDDVASLGGGLGQPAQNWLDLEGERGPSSTDQRHVADLALQYTSGMGMGGGTLLSGWRGKLIKDWTFLDSIHLGTGLPLTPIVPGVLGSVSSNNLRASYTGQSIYAAPDGKYLNPFAVSAPAAGEWGNAGIGSIVGPSQFSMNASMQRSFRLNDRFTLSLQINANNALNHVVFQTWGAIATSSQFGVAENANQMRTVTTVMRLTF